MSIWLENLGRVQQAEMETRSQVCCTFSSNMVFALCGKLVGHFPAVEAAFIKRAVAVTKGWGNKLDNIPLTTIRGHHKSAPRPMGGKWCVNGPKLNIWVDASSLEFHWSTMELL